MRVARCHPHAGLDMFPFFRWFGERVPIMSQNEYEARVAAFIRAKGVTRCPTACAFRTQGTVAAADRAALEDYVAAREWLRERRIAARRRMFWSFKLAVPATE